MRIVGKYQRVRFKKLTLARLFTLDLKVPDSNLKAVKKAADKGKDKTLWPKLKSLKNLLDSKVKLKK